MLCLKIPNLFSLKLTELQWTVSSRPDYETLAQNTEQCSIIFIRMKKTKQFTMLALTSMKVHQYHSDINTVPHKYSCLLKEAWFLSQSQPDWVSTLPSSYTKTQPKQNAELSSKLRAIQSLQWQSKQGIKN